jgi:hypothetical protein
LAGLVSLPVSSVSNHRTDPRVADLLISEFSRQELIKMKRLGQLQVISAPEGQRDLGKEYAASEAGSFEGGSGSVINWLKENPQAKAKGRPKYTPPASAQVSEDDEAQEEEPVASSSKGKGILKSPGPKVARLRSPETRTMFVD